MQYYFLISRVNNVRRGGGRIPELIALKRERGGKTVRIETLISLSGSTNYCVVYAGTGRQGRDLLNL